MSEKDRLVLASRLDVVAAVPYLLGFHPTESLVCVVVDQHTVRLVTRASLPATASDPGWPQAAADAATLIAQHATSVIMVGYGPAQQIDPAAEVLAAALQAATVPVLDVLRVEGGRYYCVTCDGSCPTDGFPTTLRPAWCPPSPPTAASRRCPAATRSPS